LFLHAFLYEIYTYMVGLVSYVSNIYVFEKKTKNETYFALNILKANIISAEYP